MGNGRRRDRRHGRRARRQAGPHPRHGVARQVHASRRGRPRVLDEANRRAIQIGRRPRSAKFGIGLKKSCGKSTPHGFSLGWCSTPLAGPGRGASGGSFLYHYDDNLVSVGFVVHLNYDNPTLSPFDKFQRFKTIRSSSIPSLAEGGSPMAHARSVLRAGNRCRVSRRGTWVSAC